MKRARLRPLAVAVFPLLAGTAALCAPGPARTDRQIEEDWLLQAQVRLGSLAGERQVRPELDALGGCDGVINGEYGFHTQHEKEPWWQVDLDAVLPLERLVVYNRCAQGMAVRTSRMRVLLSADGKEFAQAYQHDGSIFLGYPDSKPLVVALNGAKARFVRLQLPGTDYFHLDEVQVFAVGDDRNAALNRHATQSSVSQWSVDRSQSDWDPVLRTTLDSGFRLAAALRRKGVNVSAQETALTQIKSGKPPAGETEKQQLYLRARRAIREMAMANPLLDFDSIVFVKRAPGIFPHLSDQFYGWWSRPGGGLFVIKGFKTDAPVLSCLTDGYPPGSFLQPELSYDARRLLFAHCVHHQEVQEIRDKFTKANLPEDAFYHLYELDIAQGISRRLTRGRYEDFDGRYLPDGDIAFLSTRKGTFLQCSQENTAGTLTADLPDSYVRCGGDRFRPVPVYTLHAMKPDGTNLRPLSAFETFEYNPFLANDGRILYCRWDYIDRFNGHFFSLWGCKQDGSNPQLVYGNYTVRPQATMEPRAIPGSDKLLFTASAHHSISGGSLVLFDRSRGMEGEEPLTRLTPEVPFPETERNVNSYYASPWPLSEDFYLVSWSCRKLPPHCRCDSTTDNPANAQGLYLYDRFGNLELLYRDPDISSLSPIPLKPRRAPPLLCGDAPARHEQSGEFNLQSVYDGMDDVPRGTVKALRVVGVLPKVQPEMNSPPIGPSHEDTGKVILGTVPVESDGSAFFRAPSGMSLFFQALDAQGRSVQTMRSLTYLQPGQTLSCAGCHESRLRTPQATPLAAAARRPPSRIRPEEDGTLPLRFDRLVQPVLEAHCVRCHSPGGKQPPDLSVAKSYEALLNCAGGDLRALVHERDSSRANDGAALNSKLLKILRESASHADVKMTDAEWRRLYAWMDTYGAIQGCFSDEQERDLIRWRQQNAGLFEDTAERSFARTRGGF